MYVRLKSNETDGNLYIPEGMKTIKNAIASVFLIYWRGSGIHR